MDCNDCKFKPLCVVANPPPDLKSYYDWERKSYNSFINNGYAFLQIEILASGEGVALFGQHLSFLELIHWKQRRHGSEECFKSNYIITNVANSILIDCV